MPGVYGRPSVFEAITHGADDVEALVHLPQEKKTRIGTDLSAPKIHEDGAVEIRPQGLFLAATISEHLISSRSGDFCQLYHAVAGIPASFCSVPPHNVG